MTPTKRFDINAIMQIFTKIEGQRLFRSGRNDAAAGSYYRMALVRFALTHQSSTKKITSRMHYQKFARPKQSFEKHRTIEYDGIILRDLPLSNSIIEGAII